jgi:type IX secretion system PorP/SprF family membrane protein
LFLLREPPKILLLTFRILKEVILHIVVHLQNIFGMIASFFLSRGFRRVVAFFGMVWILALYSQGISAQDPIFSQFYLSPLQLNPGLAGLTEDPRFSANYRNQFPGFNNAYKTYAVSYDQYFPGINGGVGFWLLSDDAGDGILKTIKAAGIFSYRLRLNDDLFLRMGTEIGIVQSTLNWNSLRFGDQIDDYLGTISPGGSPFPTEEIAPEKNTILYPDLGLGLMLYGQTVYGGIAIRHLNQPKTDFLDINSGLTPGLPMRWTFHAGGTWPVFSGLFNSRNKVFIGPSVIFVQQGPFQQINGGVTFEIGPLTLGGYYRVSSGQSESLIGSIGLKTKQLKIGYSYDATISGFPSSGGTHEIGFVFVLDNGQKESRYNDCLRLFR